MNSDDTNHDKHATDGSHTNFAEHRVVPPTPRPLKLTGAFQLKSAHYPWVKAIRASLSMGLSLLVGPILGHTQWGLLAAMGAFTSLYVHNEPYFQRAVKLGIVALGLAASFGLGTVSAGSVWGMGVALCMVSLVATFLCGALKVSTPSAYFFILACAVGIGLPVHPADAPLRSGLAFVGGALAWILSMAGWLWNAHGPETSAVATAYRAVGDFLSTIGRPEHDAARHRAGLALRYAEDAVMAGELRWRSTRASYRLFLLIQNANELFLAGIALSVEKAPIRPELSAAVRALADAIPHTHRVASLKIPQPSVLTPPRERIYALLCRTVDIASAIPGSKPEVQMVRPALHTVFRSAVGRNSLVLPATLRIGIAVLVATLIARALGNMRPYWVPLTVACVLQGPTVLAAAQRTVQRAIGTALGVLLGGVILALHSVFGLIVSIIMVLQLVIELVIVRNYGIAVVFITPIPLLLTELGQKGMSPDSLVQARLSDTLLGCILGFVAALMLWHRWSSVRLNAVLSDAIRMEGELLYDMARLPLNADPHVFVGKRRRLQGALGNLIVVYDNATNEFPRKPQHELLWPSIVAVQRIGYFALALSEIPDRKPISEHPDAVRATFSALANAAELQNPVDVEVCTILQYPGIEQELRALRESLLVVK